VVSDGGNSSTLQSPRAAWNLSEIAVVVLLGCLLVDAVSDVVVAVAEIPTFNGKD
jgi:hypothetical protein